MSKVRLDFTDAWLDFRFITLRESIDLSEQFIEDQASAFDARVAAEAAKLPADQREHFCAQMAAEYATLNEGFANVLRRALFLVCWAEIEAFLNSLCRAAQRKLGLTCTVNGLPGPINERAKNYLTKAAAQAFPSDAPEWEKLANYRKVRNLLAHAEARLTDSPRSPHIARYVHDHPHLDLNHDSRILIRRGFCQEVVETARRFFKQFPGDLRIRTPAWE